MPRETPTITVPSAETPRAELPADPGSCPSPTIPPSAVQRKGSSSKDPVTIGRKKATKIFRF
jgi:hypothetical protein